MSERKPSVFISYSHKDEEWKDRLVQHLRVLGDESGFDVWDDRRIRGGKDWKAEIERAILSADVAVLLVSVDFLTSDFIKKEEVARLLRLREERRLTILPVIVGDCPWKRVGWLSAIQARPTDGAPLEDMAKGKWNAALARIAEEIDEVLIAGKASEQAPASEVVREMPGPMAASAPRGDASSVPIEPPRDQPPERSTVSAADRDTPRAEPAKPAFPASALAAKAPTARPVVTGRMHDHIGGLRRPVPSWLNAAVRSLPVWLIGVTALALGLYLWLWARAPPPAVQLRAQALDSSWVVWPQGVTPSSVVFETVTVNGRGDVVSRQQRAVPSFTERLDDAPLKMVAIPGGQFLMGAPQADAGRFDNEGPQRTVTIAPFFLGKFEVTQAQWRAVAGWPQVARALAAVPLWFKGDDLPVENVSWDDSTEFCARLSRRTGRAYRLPSEAEWEYAARAGTMTPFHFGETITSALVNYNGNFPYAQAPKGAYRARTTPVGSFNVGNAFGLFDMHGNVWEWTQDAWHPNYAGAPSDGSAWETGGDAVRRVVRGGSWVVNARYCRSAYRSLYRSGVGYGNVGFRVLCSVARTTR